jgi:hypothetical protein
MQTPGSSSKLRRRGRPSVGEDLPLVNFRMPTGMIAEVDKWAKRQPDKPDRSEALRRLVLRGLQK